MRSRERGRRDDADFPSDTLRVSRRATNFCQDFHNNVLAATVLENRKVFGLLVVRMYNMLKVRVECHCGFRLGSLRQLRQLR